MYNKYNPRTNTDFKKSLKAVNPSLELLTEYKDSKTRVLVKDALGTIYNVDPYIVLAGYTPSIRTAINKTACFKNKLKVAQPNLKMLGEYTDDKTKILVVDTLGIIYESIPSELLQKCNISIEKAVDKNEAFRIKASIVHNDKYNYDKVNYIHSHDKVIITCPIHGDFEQTANAHLSGNSCKYCNINRNPTWSYTDWEVTGKKSKNFDSFKCYIVECWSDNENFFKIGKTFRTIGYRFARIPYNWKLVEVEIGNAKYISELEAYLHKENKNYKYIPKLSFNGKGECFSKIELGIN